MTDEDRQPPPGRDTIFPTAAPATAEEQFDGDLFERINSLSREEEGLYARASDGDGLDAAEIERLQQIKVALDQAYDLLHQRQARRDAGLDPTEATVRPQDIVENYRQ